MDIIEVQLGEQDDSIDYNQRILNGEMDEKYEKEISIPSKSELVMHDKLKLEESILSSNLENNLRKSMEKQIFKKEAVREDVPLHNVSI